MSPFIGAALSTPAQLLIKESPTGLEENIECRLNIRGHSNLRPTQCKGPLCKTPQKALQPLLDHFWEQRAQEPKRSRNPVLNLCFFWLKLDLIFDFL